MYILKKLLWNDRFIGLQGLLCAFVGLLSGWALSAVYKVNASDIIGLAITISLLMVFIRKPLVARAGLWIIVTSFFLINVAAVIVFKPNADLRIVTYAPIAVVELCLLYYVTARMVKQTERH